MTNSNKEKNTFDDTSDNQVNENSSKMVPKSRVGRRSKKNKKIKEKKQEAEKSKLKSSNDNENTLDKEENNSILSPNKETENKKKIKNTKKNLISPSHEITEYFQRLRVEVENIAINDENIPENQIENNKNLNEHSTVNSKLKVNDAQTPGRKLRQRKPKPTIEATNHKVTEYFHVRRSERKYKKNIIDEVQKDLEIKIKNQTEDGLEIKEFEDKGRGVVTTKEFYRGEFVVEYIGDLIDGPTAKEREIKYARKKNIGCYMYYFKHKNKQYCIDATAESGKLGRLINHSRKGNLISRIIEVDQTPHLVLLAKTDIPSDTEILYDYGDRNPESVKHHPWLTL